MTQKEALDILKTGASVFLTGEPGSGKTHVIREYINYLHATKAEVAVTASTGIAATHIGGVTINSWSGIGIKKRLSSYDLDRLAANEHLSRRIARTKTLIIDEVSMLDGTTLDSIDRVCRELKRNGEPFGGMQTVLVGDFFQLPPVAKYGEPAAQFSFNAEAWAKANFLICYLEEQHRQEDLVFLDILSAMRRNAITAEHLAHLDNRCLAVAPNETPQLTRLFSHNIDVDSVNNEELKKIPGDVKNFHMESSGRRPLIETLKRGCLSPAILTLKKGAVVMFTKNSTKDGFVNGTLGTVVDFNKYSGLPIVKTKAGRHIEVESMEWVIDDNGRVLARVAQIPLRLAWAITVHKSQGMSLDAAHIDLRSAFVAGQGYVALSRVRTLAGLFLAGYNSQSLQVHPEVLERDADFREKSTAAARMFAQMPQPELQTLHRNFIRAIGGVVKTANKPKTANTYSVEKIRVVHTNAYRSWRDEDDKTLVEWFNSGKRVPDMAQLLGRKPGAIRARLKKLNLFR